MSETKYLYMVAPRIPIKGIIPDAIRREKTLELDLEQVKHCLKHGPVFRKFSNENRTEQVTLFNIDRLHAATFVEETPEQPKNQVSTEEPLVVVDEAPVTTETVPEAKVEELTSEVTETVEEVTTEEVPTVDTPEVADSEEVVEEDEALTVEDDGVEDLTVEE